MCSYDVIHGMVPDSHHKLLNNMRKAQQRKERRKMEEMTNESSHAIDDDWPRKRKHDTYVVLVTECLCRPESGKNKPGLLLSQTSC